MFSDFVPLRSRVRLDSERSGNGREAEVNPQQEEQLHLRVEPANQLGPEVQPEHQADPGAQADSRRSEKQIFGTF